MIGLSVAGGNVKARPARFDVLDFYRFLGAVGVALVHYLLIYFPVGDSFAQTMHARLQPLLGLFFTMSGFVIMHVYDGRIGSFAQYGDFVQKRLARMYPLFLATFLIACVWGMCTSTRPGMFAASAALPNLLLIHAWNTTDQLTFDYPSWSVSAEFFVYLLFPVFLWALDRMKRLAPLLPFLIAGAVALVFKLFDLGEWEAATFNASCLRAAPLFVAGMVVHRLAQGPLAGWRTPTALAHAAAIAAVVLMCCGAPGDLMLVYMGVLVFALATAEPASPGVLSRPWARALANASYGFYLLHGLVAPVILGALVRGMGWPREATFWLAPIALLVTAALSLASCRWFEDPARRYFGSLKRARVRAPRIAPAE